jgi:hypothetical protein
MTNPITLTKEFFFGGRSTFTIKSEKTGLWKTFKISRPRGKDVFFAQLLAGPDNEHSFVYIGIVDIETGTLRLTKNSKRNEQSPDVVTLRWFLTHLFTDKQLTNATVYHEGKCGCCGRKLTVPESIERGIGPECWSRLA